MNGKKLIILFPGIRYSVDMPLLYYANFKYEIQGYDGLKLSYDDCYSNGRPIDNCVNDVKKSVLKQVEGIDFSQYEDIVFVSKSIGTVIAGWLEDKLKINVRHIYLTPLEETLPYIKKDKNIVIVVAGTKDKHLDTEILRQHCQREGVNLKLIDGVGHRLESLEDMNANIDILKEIVSLY